jgi:chromosome segregation ATPase
VDSDKKTETAKKAFEKLISKSSKNIMNEIFKKQKESIDSEIKNEKEKNKKKQFSINKQQIELSSTKNEKEKNITILEMETVETFDILNDNYDKLNNEFNIENPSENFFKNNNQKINEFLDLEISKSYLFILSDVDREEKQKLINQQIIQLYNYKFELFCKLLLLYQKKIKHFFFLNLLINSSKIKINFIINMCKNLLLSNKLHNLIRKQSKNYLYKRFKQFQINCLKNEILFKDTIIYELDNNNTILQGKIQKFQLIFEEYEKSKNNKQEQTINKYESKIEQLNNLLKEKNIQYEKLKKISSESTQELIETNNENSEQKKEIKQLTIEKNNLLKKLDEYNYTLNSLKENISLREEEILKIKNENENNQNNLNLKNEELKIENINYKNKIDEMNNYLIQLNSEMKKVKFENNELKKSKEEFSEILKQTKNNEIENINLKNLLEQYKINYEEITEKYNDIKKKHDELNNIVEEREKQLLQAMGEMEGYSVLLEQIEERIRKAEEERDKAINDVKTIRQRYINLLGEDKSIN